MAVSPGAMIEWICWREEGEGVMIDGKQRDEDGLDGAL